MRVAPVVTPERDPHFAVSRVHGETAQCELLRQVVKLCHAKRHAVDVGAHIGLWTRNLAAKFEQVTAFEPVGENFACLRQNAALANVKLYNLALGAAAGTCNMKLPEHGNSGMWRVVPGPDVKVYSLDSFALETVDLLKLDVEGSEGLVICGAFETIRHCRPIVVFEDNGTGPKYFGADWTDPKPLLASLGYTLRLRWRKDRVWTPSR